METQSVLYILDMDRLCCDSVSNINLDYASSNFDEIDFRIAKKQFFQFHIVI